MLSTLKKINFLITKRQRKGLVILTFLLFIGMILEVFGLGILIPVLSLLLDPKIAEESSALIFIKDFLPEMSYQSFLYLFLISIVALYLFKSLFLVFLTYKQNSFLSNINAYISNKLFSSYLSQPYSFHLNRNASELIKNIQIEISNLSAFFLSLITIFIEGGFIVSVLATLIYLEPLGAISIGLFYGILSIFFFQFTKRKLVEWGKLRQDLDSRISKISLEGFGGIKDILILGKRSYFTNQYSQDNFLKARVVSNQNTVSQIPRFYLEFISILGLISFILMLLWQQKAIISIIAILGVFVAATFRMIPSLNRVIAALQSLKFYRSSLDVIHTEIVGVLDIKNEIKKSNDAWNFNSNIELKNIHFSYGEINILEEIDLTIYKGQTIGIIGESGSGKSTLVDLIIGLHLPTSGDIFIDGISGFQMQQLWRSKIGYISQTIFLTDDSIANNIAFGVEKKHINFDLINELLKQVQLDKFVNNLENGLDTRVGERGVQLSGGQRQRIGIARALYNNPEILILDEATSALDSFTETQVLNSIKNLKGKKTILMIAHRLTTLADCDIVYEVKNNKLHLTKI